MQSRASSNSGSMLLIKASAGSGKTHRLTGEYLRLLFSGDSQYKHILAVTFTNKATEEMKSRIVKELHTLSSGKKSDYLDQLQKEFSLSETQIREKAKSILQSILHDYSAFSINTIDRFFQQTMRAFTREMGLAGGYNIEVDETPMLLEAIDLMLSELDKPENKSLFNWLLMFMKDMIEDGKSWKIENQVYDLSKQLFNETYKSFSNEDHERISDKEFLEEYKKMLTQIVRSHENELRELGKKGLALMERFGISYLDFKYKSTSGFLLFTKLANGIFEKPSNRLIAAIDNVEGCIGNKNAESGIRSAFCEGLNDYLKRIVHLNENDLLYNTAKSILRNFYTLGILGDIRNRLRALQQENNTLFLSDTTELLNDIIADSDTPFIYEKTGTRLTSYMIDEFQDTSRMQWDNFRPLMSESLASRNFNLIVGDVKQSIYRFRNSDWRLLEEKAGTDLGPQNISETILDTNWRSDANVVHFNNAFFASAASLLQDAFNADFTDTENDLFYAYAQNKITEAYAHVYQNVPEKKRHTTGQVKITFLNNDKESDWKADALERLPLEIEALQDQGFALKDIAIVVRWNHEAVEVTETLLRYKEEHPESAYRYDIISNEALVISNAQSVKAVIALLRYFRNPKDDTKKMMAIYEFYRFHRHAQPDEAIAFYREQTPGEFPEEIEKQLSALASMPLYEMIEAFFALSEGALNEKENAYVQAFLDIALKFSANSSSNLNTFLDWWDEKGCTKTLFSSESQDAIRLITIHKSKGLGFGAVIMPFVDWMVDHNPRHNDIIWCKPAVEPFNTINVLPLRYGKNLANTIFKTDYYAEKLFTFIDNLNLLYVAFTRAKRRIIAFAPIPQKPERVSSVSELLWQAVTNAAPLPDSRLIKLNEHFTDNGTECTFELGSPSTIETENEKPQGEAYKMEKWQSVPFNDRLRLRLNSIGFFSDDGSRDYGLLMHEIISNVKSENDIQTAVEKKISEGELLESEKENTVRFLRECISIPEVSVWYSGKYEVLNEMQVLHPQFGFSRPDRVMIGDNEVIVVDYKFGEAEDAKYNRQVQYYVQRIKEMGHSVVKGFVFYVKQGKVCEV